MVAMMPHHDRPHTVALRPRQTVRASAMLGVVTDETGASAPELRIRHVLVPVDGSEFALQALPTAPYEIRSVRQAESMPTWINGRRASWR